MIQSSSSPSTKYQEDNQQSTLEKIAPSTDLIHQNLNQTQFTAMGNFITNYIGEISIETAGLELMKEGLEPSPFNNNKKIST